MAYTCLKDEEEDTCLNRNGLYMFKGGGGGRGGYVFENWPLLFVFICIHFINGAEAGRRRRERERERERERSLLTIK